MSGSPEPLRCPNGMQTRCQSEHGTSSLLSGPQQLSPAHNDWNEDSKSGQNRRYVWLDDQVSRTIPDVGGWRV